MKSLLNLCLEKVISNYIFFKNKLKLLPIDLRFLINEQIFNKIPKYQKSQKIISSRYNDFGIKVKHLKPFLRNGSTFHSRDYDYYIINSRYNDNYYDIIMEEYYSDCWTCHGSFICSYIKKNIFKNTSSYFWFNKFVNQNPFIEKTVKLEKISWNDYCANL